MSGQDFVFLFLEGLRQLVQLLNDGHMSEYGLLQANDRKMLFNDGEMLVNDWEMLVNDDEMSIWAYTHFTIID